MKIENGKIVYNKIDNLMMRFTDQVELVWWAMFVVIDLGLAIRNPSYAIWFITGMMSGGLIMLILKYPLMKHHKDSQKGLWRIIHSQSKLTDKVLSDYESMVKHLAEISKKKPKGKKK